MTDDQLTDDQVDILEVGETCSLAIVTRRGCGVCAWEGKAPFFPVMSCLPATTLPFFFFKLRKDWKPVVKYLPLENDLFLLLKYLNFALFFTIKKM